jgi:uncharacterized protein
VSNNLFVDTSGWASLFVNTQPYYSQADQYFRLAVQQQRNIVTTNYVVSELVALLSSPLRIHRPHIFEIVDAIKTVPYVKVIHIDQAIDTGAWNSVKTDRIKLGRWLTVHHLF